MKRAPFTVYLRWPGAWMYACDAATYSAAKRCAQSERMKLRPNKLDALVLDERTRDTNILQGNAQRWRAGPDARLLLLVE